MLRRLTIALALLTLSGCRPPTTNPTPRAAPGTDAPGEALPTHTSSFAVTLSIDPVPAPRGAVAFMGFRPSQMDKEWSKLGERPAHHALSDPLDLAPTLTLDLELVDGLTYLAILDLDDDGRPGEGELRSAPVAVRAGTPASFALSLPYVPPEDVVATVDPDPGPGLRTTNTGETLPLVVQAKIRPPFLKTGRVLVVGMPPADGGTTASPLTEKPTFFWASPPLDLNWPVAVSAQFPTTPADVLVVLDLDGAGVPSVGDLVSAALPRFRATKGGETVTVTLTGPLVEPVDER